MMMKAAGSSKERGVASAQAMYAEGGGGSVGRCVSRGPWVGLCGLDRALLRLFLCGGFAAAPRAHRILFPIADAHSPTAMAIVCSPPSALMDGLTSTRSMLASNPVSAAISQMK